MVCINCSNSYDRAVLKIIPERGRGRKVEKQLSVMCLQSQQEDLRLALIFKETETKAGKTAYACNPGAAETRGSLGFQDNQPSQIHAFHIR